MGTVSGNWITGTHSGRACRHENLYTRVNKKTGKCYSAKLCNPNSNWDDNQLSQRSGFGNVSKAISEWINTNKLSTASDNADYEKVKAQFDRQNKYSTLRGYIMAKGMYTVADGVVTVDISTNSGKVVTASTYTGTGGSGSSGSSSGSSTSTKYTVTLVASPTAGGSVSGAGQYTAGTTVTVKANALSGYKFSQWSDGNTSATRSVTVNSNISLTATFVEDAGASTIPEGDDADA